MTGGMFVLRDDGSLIEAREEPYESESLLQRQLADHPKLLLGDRLKAITGVHVSDSKLSMRPSFALTTVAAEPAMRQLLDSFDWAVDQLRAHERR